MSKSKCKDLYIAKSMSELNQKCLYDFDKGRSIKSHLTLVNKTFQHADLAYTDRDEERAYILYMRYLDATTKVRKSKEFQQQADHYNTLFGSAKSKTALEKAEKLSESLRKRYAKLAEMKPVKLKEEPPDNTTSTTNGAVDIKEEYVFPTELITSQELYRLLYKDKKRTLLMDIRSIDEYQDSHLLHESSINVPNNTIKPGSVTSKIEQGIPLSDIKLWNERNEVDLVILVDWHSNVKRLDDKSDPLRSLKDSLFKWEQVKELKRCPVVLEGGYSEWLDSFPQFTSNPSVTPPDNRPKTSNVNSMLDFNYADLKSSFLSSENDKIVEVNGVESNIPDASSKSSTEQVDIQPHNSNAAAPKITSSGSLSPLSGLYPKINDDFNLPKAIPQATPKPQDVVKTNEPKKMPSFDRSAKPKPNTSISSQSKPSKPTVSSPPPVSITPKPRISPAVLPVDRSTKPVIQTDVFPSEGKVDKSQIELNELEQNILRILKEKEENEKRVQEIEHKKKKAELQAKTIQMEQENKDLKQRELQAEKELAAMMRSFNKPNNSKTSPNRTFDAEDQKTHVVSDAKLPAGESKEVTTNEVILKPHLDEKNHMDSLSSKTDFVDNLNEPIVKNVTSNIAALPSSLQPKPPVSKGSKTPPGEISTKGPDYGKVPAALPPKPSEHPQADIRIGQSKPDVKPVTPGVPPPTYSSIQRTNGTRLPQTHPTPSKPVSKSSNTSMGERVYNAPLKDEPDNQSFGLKRSFSSPNIAKMVQEEKLKPQVPVVPNRVEKPKIDSQNVPIPSREVKPSYQDDTNQAMSQLNLSLRGVYGGDGVAAVCGLRNLGNSCYMNSVLQCMFNTTQLAEYILTNSYRKDINRKNILGHGGKVAESFSVLLRAVWSGQYKYLIPSDMKQIAGSINPIFSGYSQEDSHELLLMLLDGLHEDLNRIVNFKYQEEPDNDKLSDDDAAKAAWAFHKKRNESIIVELFTGQFKATVRCLSCGKASRKFDVFRFLSLSLPSRSASINDLVRDFSKEEKMTGNDKWKCPNCKVLREAVRTIAIWKLPPILIIHLKRFVHTGRWRDKIHTNVVFPMTGLDLRKYTLGPIKRHNYDLFAVSHHHGAGLDSGHYTATCRSVVDSRWYKYDDTEVYPTSTPQDATAFMLFYSAYSRQKPRQTPFT